jgi:gliding motility-associated-like protein
MRKLALALSITLFTLTSFSQNSTRDFDLDKERTFIPNLGQFDGRNWQANEIVYGYDQNPFYIFFTEKGLTYRFDKIIKNPKYIKENPTAHPKRINISELVHATWVGANENVEIVAEDKVDFSYSYAVRTGVGKEVRNIPGIPAYKKITYINLYDNIDVEYIIHPDGGVKYSVILHPGADPSQVQLEYRSGTTNVMEEFVDIELNNKGQIQMETSLGNVIEHAPYTYVKATGQEISSRYNFENNILSFELENYDPSQEVIIDPWVLSPNFNTSTAVWEVENDGAGNSYVIGGETPMELRKYNAAGVQQWIYVTPWDTNSVWLGTLATDDAGNSFITSGTSPEIERVDNAGNMQWHANGGGISTEYWSITFNCDKTKLIVGGTGSVGLFGFEARIYDIDINNGSVLNQQTVGQQAGFTPVEVRSISSSKNAKYIYLTHDQVGAINQNIGACPNDDPYFELDNGHNLAYKCENYLPETQNGGGLKALVANDNFLYTHAGDQIYQRSLIDGSLINSAGIPGGNTGGFGGLVVHNSGLAVDDCGNVYVGSDDRVVKYDPNLNFIAEQATGFSVYDVSVNSNGEVLAVGAQQDNGSVNRNGRIQSINLSACAQYALVCCDANICPQDTLCETDIPVNLVTTTGGGTFSGTGITDPNNGTFDPGTAGAGVHTITYTQTCGSDQINVVVDPCASLTACVETDGSITVSNGTGPYTWEEWVTTTTTSNDCVTCGGTVLFGACIGASTPCSITTTGYQFFANGTTVMPTGNYPIQITDNNGATIVINDPNLLPNCTTTCDATIDPSGPFCQTDAAVTLSAAQAGGTWSGTGITNGTTGTFDPATAGPGTHTITYTLTCGDTDTEDIVVNPTDDASFSYAAATYCTTDTDPTPTITGLTGGTFSIDNGGSINAGTGVIDLDASGPGSYTITYLTNGPCPTSSTFSITITNNADATITTAGPFCENDAAVTLSAVTGGGTWSGTGITNGTTGEFDPSVAGVGTHTITYTIAGSCGATDTENITVNATDDPSFLFAQGSYCLSDPNPTPTVSGLGGGTFTIDNGGSINPTTGEIDITGSGAGSYTVTYTTNGPCPTSTTFAVSLTTGANATITAAGPFCESDAAVILSAVDAGGTWSGTGITNATTGEFDPSVAGAGTHTITYTISGSCGATDTEDITVNADDDATFDYSAGSYCLTDPNPSANITGTTGGTFTIDNGGTINPTTGEIDITASGAGSYTVTYTTAGPCPDSQTFAVTLTTGADATITAAGPFCETDAAVNLTAVDAGGTWSGTGITDPVNGTFDPAVAGAGTHTITYTISGSCGDTDTEDIVVNPTDDPSFSYAQGSYCLTDPNPSATITGLTGGTFTIDNGGTINPTTGEIDIVASGAGSYTVTYTTNGPCPTSTTFAVTLTSGADATITATGPFCATDAAVNLTAVDAGGTWSGTGITDPNAGTFDPAVAGAGTHTITYTISGSCGDTDTEDIVVNAADDASFNYTVTSFCLSDPDPVANITGTTGGTFTINNGGTINPSTGEIDLDNPGAGTYTVTYTTNGPCPASTDVVVTITTALNATINHAGPFCEGDAAVNLSAADAGGTWSGTGITDGNAGTFDPSVAGVGTHTITYTIAGACGSTDQLDITVSPQDDASFSYTSTSLCLNDVNPLPNITGTTGGTFTIDNGGSIDASTGEIDLQASGSGTFTVTYTTSGPCPDVATATITINSAASATITPAGPYCEYMPDVNLVASTPGGVWSGTGITDSLNGEFSPSNAGPGSHEIIYTLGGLCGGADTITIDVYSAPIASVTPQIATINYGSFVSLTATGGGTYNWTPSEGLSCNDCADPVASPEVTTTYCVAVADSGCFDTACVTIEVEFDCGELYVPNVFTPNSGDVNSLECVMGGACITQLDFRIYNRWGELVFQTSDPDVCWDGTHMRNGKPMSTAVFAYILDATLITGEEINKKGNISLIR